MTEVTDAASEITDAAPKKENVVRALYNWVVSWADSPYGVWALFFIALVESSIFPIPPDVLLLALAFGAPKKSYKFAGVCAVGSIVGAVIGYGIGVFFFDSVGMWVVNTYHLQSKLVLVEQAFNKNAFAFIMLAGFTPIPFKVITIASGMMKVPLSTLVVGSAISRTGRFVLVATFVFFMGEKAKGFIDKYFEMLTIAFTVLLLGGFALLKYL